jgi:hypothetical protein
VDGPADRALRIAARRAKLLGLDSPVRAYVRLTESQLDVEVVESLAEVGAYL